MTFLCKGGKQLCSREILAKSDFLWESAAKKTEFGKPLEFDYTYYNWNAVKLFLDCLHDSSFIPAGPIDIITLIECIDLAQFGTTTYGSFEVELVKRLIDSMLTMKLPLCTELLISAFLNQVGNMIDDRYQQKVAERLAQEVPSVFVFANFDMEDALNKQLIAMCVKKKVFANDLHELVLGRMIMYVIDNGFTPDPSSTRYFFLFCSLLRLQF